MQSLYRQLFFLTLFSFATALQGQSTFQKLFTQEVSIESVIDQAANGDIIWTIDSYNDTASFFHRLVVLRLDANANILQSKGFSRPPSFRLGKVQPTSDNGIILTGTSNIPLTDNDSVFVVKLNANSEISWTRAFQLGMDIHEVGGVYETNDGSIIVYGLFEDFNIFEASIFLTKIDPSGTLLWSRQIQSQLNGAFLKVGGIVEAANGELFLSGSTRFNSEGSWLAKLNTDGLLQNVTFYDTHGLTDSQPEPFAIYARSNGQMDIFYNSTAFQDKSILLALRTDASGVPLQAKRYYIPHPNGGDISNVSQAANDAYVLSGYHFPNGIRSKGLAFGLDASDNITWTGDYGTDYIEILNGAVPSSDGGLMMAGFADPDSIIISPSENGLFPWLIKTDAMGQTDCYSTITISSNDATVVSSTYQLSENSGPALADFDFFNFDMSASLDSLSCTPTAIETLPTASFKLYPNPTSGPLRVELAKPFPGSTLLLSNQMGQSVLRRNLHTEQSLSLEIDAPAGLYYLSLLTPSGERLSRKLVLE